MSLLHSWPCCTNAPSWSLVSRVLEELIGNPLPVYAHRAKNSTSSVSDHALQEYVHRFQALYRAALQISFTDKQQYTTLNYINYIREARTRKLAPRNWSFGTERYRDRNDEGQVPVSTSLQRPLSRCRPAWSL